MNFIFYLSLFLIFWGAATLLIAVLKPDAIWKIGKIQGFVQVLGEAGATFLFSVLGIVALVGGIVLLFS